jgi:hypothetical protein
MKANSVPSTHGFPVVFFQKFWEKLQGTIMPMFQEFYVGTLDMGRLNYGVITLILGFVRARGESNKFEGWQEVTVDCASRKWGGRWLRDTTCLRGRRKARRRMSSQSWFFLLMLLRIMTKSVDFSEKKG